MIVADDSDVSVVLYYSLYMNLEIYYIFFKDL